EYQARFVADDAAADTVRQNNRATSFTQVRGKGHVLIVEDWEHRGAGGVGEFDYLVSRLKAAGLEVTVQFTDEMFTSLGELQRFDTVILANVPRSSGSTAENMTNFSDRQIEMLIQNTQQMGCGLVMLGGPESFGAGGWANSSLEKAMPVDFQIRNARVQAVGALAMVMHASEMAEGNYWQKIIGREAINALGPQDYCAVVEWKSGQGREGWLWGGVSGFLPVGGNERMMIGRLDRMTPGDMPDFDPSMKMALSGFNTVKAAAVKHMIIISDGDPTAPSSQTLKGFKQAGVKITTVAVGAHGTVGSSRLRNIARTTGGKYYVVRSPNALPKIYQREARRVSRPVLVERQIQPRIVGRHEILRGIDAFPPLSGFVMTTVKENPLVEVSVLSDYPSDVENASLLATWNYGLGRTVAFTSDAGARWAKAWTEWDQYDKFFSQLVRWSMRPTGDTGNFAVVTRVEDGRLKVIVDALDKNDEFLNFLNVAGTVVSPGMESQSLALRQTAPGRYVGEVEATESGSYFVNLIPGAGRSPIRTGVNVPYSSEFRDRETNIELLKSLAQMEPVGGEAGQLVETGFVPGSALGLDPFRRTLAKAISGDSVWPLLLLVASAVFFGDVFIRRVAVSFDWLPPVAARVTNFILRRVPEEAPDQELARLRSRKAEVTDELAQRRAAAKFEPDADAEIDVEVLQIEPTDGPRRKAPGKSEPSLGPAEEESSFTSRLLKAKQQAQKKKNEGDRRDS
ncbi:MAG: glutamine amidotransferase, partial [Planctomycetota bacterium]